MILRFRSDDDRLPRKDICNPLRGPAALGPLYEKVVANALTTAYGAPSSLTARAQICAGSRTPL
jgi:hypothetical protein